MRHHGLAERLLLSPAIALVLMSDALAFLWCGVRRVFDRLGRAGPLPALQARIACLPPKVAVVLFLVPEACSRGGWLTSAWLLVHGRDRVALLVYGATKLTAGLAALWIFRACEPSLMRVRWFAVLHTSLHCKLQVCRLCLRRSRPPATLFARARLVAYPRLGRDISRRQ